MSLHELSATKLHSQLTAGKLTSVEVATAFLDRIEQHDSQVGAFLAVRREQALEHAADVDQRRSAGNPVGMLAGLPVAVKDVLCTQGETTTCGSKMLAGYRPPYNATVIEKLLAADAVILGKTNMDEFAMGSSTENSAFQPTKNPWELTRTPGGSSGGAAAALAAGMAPLSIGTDTGGSIRQPAAFCSVTGMKPTYGRVSRYGLIAFASSLDQVGPMAGSVQDTALLLEAIAGHDPLDSTSANEPTAAYAETASQPLAGLKLGMVTDHFGDGLDSEVEASVREAIKVYESLGAKISEVELPHSKYGIAAYYIIAPSEASSNLSRYDGAHYGYRTDEKAMLAELAAERQACGDDEVKLKAIDSPLVRMYAQSRAEGFGAEVKRRIMLGVHTLSSGYYDAYYLKALKVRRLIQQDFQAAFREVDLLIGPVTPTAPYRLGEKTDDPLAMYLGDLYTVGANLAGVAGMSLPCGFTQAGLPIGLHLQASPFAEEKLLRAGCMFQQATDWHTMRAALS